VTIFPVAAPGTADDYLAMLEDPEYFRISEWHELEIGGSRAVLVAGDFLRGLYEGQYLVKYVIDRPTGPFVVVGPQQPTAGDAEERATLRHRLDEAVATLRFQ
jgi:hypothetical protein